MTTTNYHIKLVYAQPKQRRAPIGLLLTFLLLSFLVDLGRTQDIKSEYQINIFGQDSTGEFTEVGETCTVILLEKNHNKSFLDTLKLTENHTSLNASFNDCAKLLIVNPSHKAEEHFLVFARYGQAKEINIYLRKEDQQYRYFKNFRLPFDPILNKAFVLRTADSKYADFEKMLEQNDFTVLSSKCPVYGVEQHNDFVLAFQAMEKWKSVNRVLPLWVYANRGKKCKAFSEVIRCGFSEDVSATKATKVLQNLGFIDVEIIDKDNNIFRFETDHFAGYDFLTQLESLWERTDVLSVENIIIEHSPTDY